jgi:hypothetical protein
MNCLSFSSKCKIVQLLLSNNKNIVILLWFMPVSFNLDNCLPHCHRSFISSALLLLTTNEK